PCNSASSVRPAMPCARLRCHARSAAWPRRKARLRAAPTSWCWTIAGLCPVADLSSAPQLHPRAAAAWMLVAGLLFAIMDAAIKWIAESYSPFQVATLRSIAAMPLVLLWIILRGRLGTLRHIHWPLHLVRGVIGVGVMTCFIYGVARMPLSTAYAIVFAAPLLITALAVPLLGEKVGPRRWTAILVGLAGVLVVLRPGVA